MNYSKQAIAEAFMDLLDEKPLSKITVKDIVERCGVNRNTFYYHFQDIPALLEAILTGRIDQLIHEHCRIGSLEDCISVVVQYFTENKRAVMHVYRSMPREVFLRHLDRMLQYLVDEYIGNISQDMEIREEDQPLIKKFFKCLLVGVFLDWLESGMSYDLLSSCLRVCQLRWEENLHFLRNASKE